MQIDPKIQQFTNDAIEIAKTIASHKELQPVAFIVNLSKGIVKPLFFNFNNQTDKGLAATKIRHTAMEMDADFVFVVLEIYMKRYDKDDPEAAKVQAGEMRVRDTPGRIEAAAFILETRDGSYMGTGELKGEFPNRTFETPVLEESNATGIFTNLLPDKRHK